jgi:hypothetical protein
MTYLYGIRLRSQQAEQEAAGSAGHQEEVNPVLNTVFLSQSPTIYVFLSQSPTIYMSFNTLLYTGIYYIGMCDSSAMRSELP